MVEYSEIGIITEISDNPKNEEMSAYKRSCPISRHQRNAKTFWNVELMRLRVEYLKTLQPSLEKQD